MQRAMQQDAIFVLQEGSLRRLEASMYESEALLQRLLADFPDLLAGAQIDSKNPRRWALIAREIGVPASESGSSRWSLDHLFLDQDGIPTVVEVKRSSDTRIRREVVGQMLDYAANGVRYWPVDKLREAFESTHGGEDSASTVIAELVGDDDVDVDAFWNLVADNLRTGRVRMLFVADKIPTELQTIIEYLNEQMATAEVLGIEIKKYEDESLQTLVPRVIGLTAAGQRKQRPSASYEELLAEAEPATRKVAERLRTLATDSGCEATETRTALKVALPSGRSLLLLYPHWNRVEFYLAPLWDLGLTQEAEDLFAQFVDVQGGPLTERHPYLATEAILEHWGTFADQLFPRYVDAHRNRPSTRDPKS